MTLVALTNSISPSTVERATADSDPYERETQLNSFAHNFDDHDHALGKNLGVKRLQTTVAPAASGEVRISGDALLWWGSTSGAIQSALTVGADLADPVVRDALSFGEQGTALAPDVLLTRTAAGVLGLTGALSSAGGTTARLAIGATGTVTLTPDAAGTALVATNGLLAMIGANSGLDFGDRVTAGAHTYLFAEASGLSAVQSGTGQFQRFTPAALHPVPDNAQSLGVPTYRFTTVYATTGTINTSSADAKENLRDFDADDALDALRVLRVRRFDYKRPDGVGEGDEDPAAVVLRKNLVGFVSEEAPALFTLGDDRSVSPQQTAVISLAVAKVLLAKLDAHEVRLDALEAGD